MSAAPLPGRRRRRAELALACGSLALFLGTVELAARAIDLRPASGGALANPPWLGDRWLLRRDYREELAAAGLLGRYYDLFRWDRLLFYRLRPDVHLELIDVMAPRALRERTRWSVHTNARGFRGSDFAPRQAAGTTRIAVLGDSTTFGWGVEHFEAYPGPLRHALARRWRLPRDRVEVLNLGVPGYSSFQGRVLLERVALPLAPDAVVWSYLANDGAVTGEGDAVAYARRLGPAGAVLEALHASRAFEALESWIAVARARRGPPAALNPRDPAQRNVRRYDAARENVRAAVGSARAAGVPIVLLGSCVRGAPAAVLRQVAEAEGVPHLDGAALLDAELPALAAEPRYATARAKLAARWGEAELARHPHWLAFLPDGCHPNAIGHQIVADALAEAVVRARPEPAAR